MNIETVNELIWQRTGKGDKTHWVIFVKEPQHDN